MEKLLKAAALLLCLFLSTPVFAQTSNATVGGTVSDATGALIPGVTVTATNVATGIVTTVISNEAGAYQFASLQTGTYAISAELAGFRTQTFSNAVLGVSQQVRMNFTLQVGQVAQAVEVTAATDTAIATTSASVGTVLPESKVRDLPLAGRNVMDFLTTTAGAGPTDGGPGTEGNFAGGRLSAVNTTRDGFNISDGRYNFGAFAATYTTPDLVEEVRVITAPVDAEAGRGSGQVQMVTRSGTNQFRGSAYWTNRNSALIASNWFNNFNNAKKDYENRNQFGIRLGGPVIKNKTFFFFLIDEQRYTFRQNFVGPVLTPEARQGIFRFFPGVDNQNVTQNAPTVDRSGNPVDPTGQGRQPSSISVFNRDPSRPGPDPTGFMQSVMLSRMPLPNDYTVGDGLNTAGYRWVRRVSGLELNQGNGVQTNRDQFNTRIDHQFNANHKFSFIYTWEQGLDQAESSGIPQWPGGYYGTNYKWPMLYNFSLVSTLSPSVVNELRIGYKRTKQYAWGPMFVGRHSESQETGVGGQAAYNLLPKSNGVPFGVVTQLFPNNFMLWASADGSTREQISPLETYGDTISFTRGVHAFKTGGEFRTARSNAANDSNFFPLATLGAGGVAIQNLDSVSVPGLTGNNTTTARALLTDLAGSINNIAEAFDLRSSKNLVFQGYADGVKFRRRDHHNKEFAAFFKDDWKIRPSLTLNLGIHWEYYGVPWEGNGLFGRTVGGQKGLCGISCGALTVVELVGKNSPNPDKQIWNDDYHSFAPAVGLSWSLPWFGKGKTVLRTGYSLTYPGNPMTAGTDLRDVAGSIPTVQEGSTNTGVFYTPATYLGLNNISLPIPQQFKPLQPDPLDGPRTDIMQGAADNRVSPYVQNVNFGIQRELANNMSLTVSYVGTKGTRLWNSLPLDAVNINASAAGETFLDAFNVTRAGGNAPLFDLMLKGMNIPGAGIVNGTTLTGSAALRTYTSTRAFIGNGNIGQLADFLNRSTNITGKGGGFVRNSGLLPENFFVVNPQFSQVYLHSNPSSSTYHSMQVQLMKRLSQGFTNQTTWVWSRALGQYGGEADTAVAPRDPNNRAGDHSLASFHRTHSFTSNGTYELPFGPNRQFLGGAPAVIQRLVERWQFGGIFSWTSGAPLSVVAPTSTIWQTATSMTPNVVGDFPKSMGKVTKLSNGVTYFPGLQQVTDPAVAGVSSLNGLNGSFSNKAIADSQGKLLLVNAAPGQVGNLGLMAIQGPALLGLDVNLIKHIRITETKEFEFRVDASNVLNHPNFGAPNLNINSIGTGTATGTGGTNVAFGRITTAGGNRSFVINSRLNF
jgi:hypothetical protein